jgi:hypothetical protein
MQNETHAFVKLRLKQARRREIPYTAFKWILAIIAILFIASLLQNCGAPPEKPTTEVQKKQNVDALWAGDAQAHKKRMP